MDENKMGVEQELYLAPEQEETLSTAVENTAKTDNTDGFFLAVKQAEPKKVKAKEIPELRGTKTKVFRMSDGTEQAVFYPHEVHVFDDETQAYQEIDNTLTEEEDGRHFISDKNGFIARFSREEENDELFCIEQGMHRVTVLSKKNKKNKNKGVKPDVRKKEAGIKNTDIIKFADIENGADYEYCVQGNGVKEEIVIKEKSTVYRYPFIMRCENVTASFDEQSNRVSFLSNETGEEVFYIPAPFMTDANGVTSTDVSYMMRNTANGDIHFSVTADSQWINSSLRAFPVVIDPQIKLSSSNEMITYSWDNGYITTQPSHKIGTVAQITTSYIPDNSCGDCLTENMQNAKSLALGKWISGSIENKGDKVWYKFTANAGSGSYVFSTQGSMDTIGYLYDNNGYPITHNDDCNGLNFKIAHNLTFGQTYYLEVSSYGGKTGNYSVGVTYDASASGNTSAICYRPQRMYMEFNMPKLPQNPRIKKAELKLYQRDGRCDNINDDKIALYKVTGEITSGAYTPTYDEKFIDYARMKTESYSDGNMTSYSFDITTLVDMIENEENAHPRLMLKMLNEYIGYENYVELYGVSGDKPPEIVITYESSYGVNTSYRTHTHELGRFGQGSIDLQRGNLMFESEDFSWGGNRMPVTIKHLYNSALSDCQYDGTNSIGLQTADFGGMKLGNGFKLNIMQSMVETSNGDYVYIGENGEETYFKASDEAVSGTNGQCGYLYKDTDGGEMTYNPIDRTLTQGDEVYKFENGRLVSITQGKNVMLINYGDSGQITSVVDGAGRDFYFDCIGGVLNSITAPDGTVINYSYNDELLTRIDYWDGSRTEITYDTYSKKPSTVSLFEADKEAAVYKVEYVFAGDKLTCIKEYGSDGTAGARTDYAYSAASGRTVVQTYEIIDDAECSDCYEAAIKTVYTFDDDGNIISEYVYSEDTGNVAAEGEESGINPHSSDGGANVVSNINNLLLNHNFEYFNNWDYMPSNCCETKIGCTVDEKTAKFGKTMLQISTFNTDAVQNGLYQVTNMLPAGEYTFSAYMKVETAFNGIENSGAYLRVTATDGTVLAESERVARKDSEFIRLVLPFELGYSQSVKAEILADGCGTVLADAAQLENNSYANAYNMLVNGNFENGVAGWCTDSGVEYTTATRFNMSRSVKINGNINCKRFACQDVPVKSERTTREAFTLSGWAKGVSLPKHERDGVELPTFRLRAVIKYNDTHYGDQSTEEYTADFSPCTEEWQLASVEFSKSKYRTVECVQVYLDYDYNYGTVYFDDIQLVRNSIETDLSAEDFETEPETTEETAEAQEAETQAEAETEEDTGFTELVDKYGNTLTETTFQDGEFGTIYRSFCFTPDCNCAENAGNDLISETDARGHTTHYTVDEENSRNEEVTDRCENKTAYDYDDFGRTTKVTSFKPQRNENGEKITDENGKILYEEIATVSYAYDSFDNLTEIARGDGLKYALKYNAFHNLESIGIDGKNDGDLIKYTYKNGNGRLKEMSYANGDKMTATYNGVGQMVAEKWYDINNSLTAHYKYVYDGQGNIVRSIDIKGKKAYNYLYEDGKIMQSSESDIELDTNGIVTKKTFVCSVRYYYGNENDLTKKHIKFADGKEFTVNYEQAENDSQIVKFTAGGKTVTSHSKSDSFGRKEFDELQLGSGFLSRQFSYVAGVETDEHTQNNMLKSSPTTQLVSQIVLSNGLTLSYGYDEEERITSVTETRTIGGVPTTSTTLYTYDALGQLVTETKDGQTVNEMTYDNYGNIRTKNGIEYAYDQTWKDKLICYDGKEITYDKQGNPIEYLGHNLTWEKGRQLKSFEKIKDDGTKQVINYTYNANGIRTSKTVDGIKHDYVLDGAKILRETWTECEIENTLIPLYDNEDSVCGIEYNGTAYYFLKNQQGDIISITDNAGKEVASYTYDAWGKCTITQDISDCDIANINPFRYRSYYFDRETGLYYLQSRYYDAEVGRFLNGDAVEFATIQQGAVGHNLFAYCGNEPVLLIDPTATTPRKSYLKALEPATISNNELNQISSHIKHRKSCGANPDMVFSKNCQHIAPLLYKKTTKPYIIYTYQKTYKTGTIVYTNYFFLKQKVSEWKKLVSYKNYYYSGIFNNYATDALSIFADFDTPYQKQAIILSGSIFILDAIYKRAASKVHKNNLSRYIAPLINGKKDNSNISILMRYETYRRSKKLFSKKYATKQIESRWMY